jgi:hypothetical protein
MRATWLVHSIPRSWVLARHLDVLEEDLVEVRAILVHQLRQWTHADSGALHVDDEHADAPVLGGLRIGAHEAEAQVRVGGTRGPDLLSVDDEDVVLQRGTRREAGEVAARAGLAHAEAPGDVSA